MTPQSLSADPPALLLTALALLGWFYTIWQSFVIEGTRARLAGLKEVWHETLSLDPKWRMFPAVAAVDRLLDSSGRRLPRLSLASLGRAALLAGRERSLVLTRFYEGVSRLPSRRLQEEAIATVETAARYVALAALKRSLLAWALSPLLVAAFIVWSVGWQLRIVLEGAPQAWLHIARLRLRRKALEPLVEIVMSASPS